MVVVPETLTAGVDVSLTVIVKLLQMVLLHLPSARTKYVVVEAGETEMLLPVPTAVPAQLPLYHFHEAVCPNEPPKTESVVEVPRQMVLIPVMAVAGNDESCTTMLMLAQAVVLQVPSALR
jgi:hypothetical protein